MLFCDESAVYLSWFCFFLFLNLVANTLYYILSVWCTFSSNIPPMESQIPRQRAECVLTAACITNLEFKSVSHKTHRDIIMEAFIKPAQTVQNHHNSQSESFLQVN